MINKPILFLDVDGVLNNDKSLILSTEGIRPAGNISAMTVDIYCVKLFKLLVEITNCDIVLSSSWRAGWMDHKDWDSAHGNGTIIRALKWAGWENCQNFFIGNTPESSLTNKIK